jgi:hypothetical protein
MPRLRLLEALAQHGHADAELLFTWLRALARLSALAISAAASGSWKSS